MIFLYITTVLNCYRITIYKDYTFLKHDSAAHRSTCDLASEISTECKINGCLNIKYIFCYDWLFMKLAADLKLSWTAVELVCVHFLV